VVWFGLPTLQFLLIFLFLCCIPYLILDICTQLKAEVLRAYELGFLSFNVSSDSFRNTTDSLSIQIPGLDNLNPQALSLFAPGLASMFPNSVIRIYG
jgi:hypothetical protein